MIFLKPQVNGPWAHYSVNFPFVKSRTTIEIKWFRNGVSIIENSFVETKKKLTKTVLLTHGLIKEKFWNTLYTKFTNMSSGAKRQGKSSILTSSRHRVIADCITYPLPAHKMGQFH